MEYGANWSRLELKTKAKEAFRGNYGSCVLMSIILMLLSGVVTAMKRVGDEEYYFIEWGVCDRRKYSFYSAWCFSRGMYLLWEVAVSFLWKTEIIMHRYRRFCLDFRVLITEMLCGLCF